MKFTADQIPGEQGLIDIATPVSENYDYWHTSSYVYIYPDGSDIEDVYPQKTELSTLSDSSQPQSIRSALDATSDRKRREKGILRVQPGDERLEKLQDSRFDIDGDKTEYIASFPMKVEFGSKNASTTDNRILEKL